jgi:predicted DNA-binding protein YlxM (UPF0122 family)
MFGNLLTAEQKSLLTEFYSEFKDTLTAKQKETIGDFYNKKLKPTFNPLQTNIVKSILDALEGK